MDLRVGDLSIGRAGIGLRFKSPESYTALRLRNRDQRPLPSSADHPQPGSATGAPVEPYRVGRANADNVVLTGIEVAADTLTAGIRTPGSHPSMFDHPQDHLPGMVIAEAARQIALYGALDVRGMSPSRTYPTDLAVTFSRFGELDSPTTLTAVVGERRDAGRPGEGASYYTQGGIVELGDESTPDTDRVPVRVEATRTARACACSHSTSPASGPHDEHRRRLLRRRRDPHRLQDHVPLPGVPPGTPGSGPGTYERLTATLHRAAADGHPRAEVNRRYYRLYAGRARHPWQPPAEPGSPTNWPTRPSSRPPPPASTHTADTAT